MDLPGVELLDKGFLVLEKAAGDDLMIVNAARMSFKQRSLELTSKEEGLINFLMRGRHGTPFEMVEFWWHVKTPIFVAREWMRHRIASYNEMSGRYRELPLEFYLPALEQCRTQVGKPGNYHFEPLPTGVAVAGLEIMKDAYAYSASAYKTLLGMGFAKEVARDVLPVGIYTEFLFKTNLRSLMNFVSLRADEHALYEIRVYAQAMAKMIAEVVPIAWAKFEEHGREVP